MSIWLVNASWGSACYMFVSHENAKSWDDAQAACVGMKGTLVKINNTALLQWIQGEVSKRVQSDSTTTEWWTSLKKMSGNNWSWSDGTAVDNSLGLWMSNQPNNAISPGCARIAQVDTGIGLSVASCAQEKAYICQRDLTAPAYCDSDSGWESHHGNCYKFFDYRKQWPDAKLDCENHGAVLARPMTKNEQRAVYDLAVSNRRDSWIGLMSALQGGNVQWQWANGSVISTSPFWKTQPSVTNTQANNTCAVEHIDNDPLMGWAPKACDEERQYICQKPEAICAPGWKAFGTMCYQFDPRFLVSWNSAKSYCESQGGGLLEITSADIQQFLNGYLEELRESGLSYMWLGLSGRSTFAWSSGAALTYSNWQSTPRSSSYNRCAYIYTSSTRGQWTATTYCTQLRGVACQIPSTVAVVPATTPTPRYVCERGWSIFNSHTDDHCYKFNTTTLLNWGDAEKACKQLGGDLATITDSSAQSYLNRYLRGNMWIGLNDMGVEGTFTWIDGNQASYMNWFGHDVTKINDDNKDCVLAVYDYRRKGTWKPTDCSDINGFVCQKPALNAGTPTASAVTTQRPWSVNCGPFWEELSSSGGCYQFHEEQKTYADAQNFCSHYGGNLASITTVAEQNYIQGRIGGMHSLSLWVGGNDLSVEGGWSWQDKSPFTYINWEPGEPNNDEDSEDCVSIYTRRGTWSDNNCNLKNGFICKKMSRVTPSPSSTVATTPVPAGMLLGCPHGWLSFNNQCYQINKGTKTWSQALTACRGAGGDLTSITTLGEQDFLYSQARSVPGPLWIGFSARRSPRYYQWSDGRRATYTHWSRDEPNNSHDGSENCVTFNALGAGYWSDTVCNLPSVAGYICKRPPSVVSATTPPNYKIGCPSNGVGYFNLCYLFIETKMTFADAESYCVQQSGHLITVLDRFISAFLSSEMSQHNGMYWIGLQTYQSGYYYYYWTSKARVRFTNFDQSHTGREVASCVSVKSERPPGLWHNQPCTTKLPFICETKRVGFTLPPPGQQTTLSNRCPSYYTEYNGYCYRLMSTSYTYRKSWREARDYCRMYGGDLVSVHNSTEAVALKKYVFRYSRGSYWIGLNNLTGTKGYSWSDGSGFTYSKWGSGEPNNFNKNEDCVEWEMSTNSWRDANCFVGKSYACQVKKGAVIVRPTVNPASTTKPPVTCGTARYARYWKYYKGACYYFSYASMTWYDALNYCRKTVKGDLISLHSTDDANFLASMVSKMSGSVAWIGLNELDLSGYKWSDNSAVQFRNWAKNEPNDGYGGQKCTVVSSTDGYWSDENCGQHYQFVCRQPVGNTPHVTPAPTKPLPGNCRQGWTNFGNKCYLVKDGYYVYNDSVRACKRYGKGFDLVSIVNDDEQAFVYSILNGKIGAYWIGLNQMQRLRSFVWLDNSPITYTNWDYMEPNGSRNYYRREECVEIRTDMYSAGKWADVLCLKRQGYICQGYKEATNPVPKTSPLPGWCKAGYQVYGQSCYKMDTTARSWDDASAACKKDGAHLVSIGDAFEQAHVRVMTYGQKMNFWTGMTDRKLKGVYRWSDNWPVLYVNWGRGEPSRMDGEGCVALVTNGTWNDTMCSKKYGAICEISHGTPPPHTTMAPGYCTNSTWKSFDRYCYYVSSRSYNSWPESQFYCKKIGMRLVTIHSADHQSFIMNLIKQQTYRTSYYYWVGLVIGQNNGFEWADTTSVKYTNWARNEPSNGKLRNAEACVQMHPTTGEWYDTYCTTRRPFICMADMVFPTVPGSGSTPQPGQSTQKPQTQKPPLTNAPGQSTQSPAHQTDKKPQTPRGKPASTARGKATLPGHSTPTAAPGVSTHGPNTQGTTKGPEHLHGNQPNSGGGLSGGAIAGIIIGLLLSLGLVGLGLIFARRRGIISIGPNLFAGGSFENALYKKNADDVDIQ
ncbi:macrophage mannose receptor 1-like isoform X2 [Liolophura sinensis]